jgi:hypothetical protein
MEVYKYQSINEVPQSWRTHKSARLSLAQINEIMTDAHANPFVSTTTSENEDGMVIEITSETPDYGGARRRFSESHHIENSFWVNGAAPVETPRTEAPSDDGGTN